MTEHVVADEHLVLRAQRGERGAFDELARRHIGSLEGVLMTITRDRDAAREAIQEALTRAWLSIGRFEGRSRFSTWLTRIAINEAYRGLDRNVPEPMEVDDLVGRRVPSWGEQPDEVFASREFLSNLQSALSTLPVDYRLAVVLRDIQGLSTAEAAEALDIGERALKSRVHRGRMALRAALDHYFSEDTQ